MQDTTGTPLHGRTDDSKRTSVAELRKGMRVDGGIYLVEEANFKQTRNSKYFIQFLLRDKTGSVKAVKWEATPELYSSLESEDFIQITGRVEEFHDQLQIILDQFVRVSPEQVNYEEFLPVSPRDPLEMERELQEAVASIGDPHIKALLTRFLADGELRKGLLRCPAGKTLHHAYVGGLLEHILSLVGAAKLICRNYPALNADVLVAAAMLHDIGKVRELSYVRAFSYTDEGQLVGHIGIALLLLAEKAKEVPDLPNEVLLHLQHIIASHHGLPEHGAMKLPMTAEAITFHYLDNLDAKLAMVEGIKKELALADASTDQDRRWTDFKQALGRRLFFPG